MDSFVRLAGAIIELAAQDYRAALTHQTIDAKNAIPGGRSDADIIAEECRKFFMSKWFNTLSMSDMDGEDLINRLDRDVKNGWVKPLGRNRKGSFL